MPTARSTAIAECWQGKRLHKPNDVVTRSDGSIYFTDPSPPPWSLKLREYDAAGVFPHRSRRRGAHGHRRLRVPQRPRLLPRRVGCSMSPSGRVSLDCIGEEERGEVCTHRKIRAFDVRCRRLPQQTTVSFADMSSSEPGVPGRHEGRHRRAVSSAPAPAESGSSTPDGTHVGVIRGPEVPRNIAFGGPRLPHRLHHAGHVGLQFSAWTTPGIKP